ncbi:MAG TPA: nucleotide exchange factor GrpE [Patescibacteria group bacterium]|nr:nucleotide exchange factor GrpE [Patescibacteria group bacterium]
MKKQTEDWKSKYLRALADYQNLEKRTSERVNEVRQFAAEIMLSRLLPIVDTFSKVKEHLKDPGLELAYKELLSVLTEQGVEHIEVIGRQFDPMSMDCVEVVPGNDNEVVEEVLPGYRFRGKILRVAKVKVGKQERS